MQIEERILAELRQRKPARLLAEGRAAQDLAQRHVSLHGNCALASAGEMANLALGFVERNASKKEAFARIGWLKQQAPVVLVAATDGLPLTFNDFLAFGMQRLCEADSHGLALYLFDLYTYKPAPDWLNPKYWAHPERWEL